jgi:preprotein translocase subunit YajC
VGDEQLTVEIAPGTNIKLDKRAVAMIVSEEDQAHQQAHEEA